MTRRTRRALQEKPGWPASVSGMADPLQLFSAPVRDWFTEAFAEPTPPQLQGWPAIAAGDHTLILAPTGTGKTLSAFLWAIDRLSVEPVPDDPLNRTRVLYVSPLRALAVDVNKNLRDPLEGIEAVALRNGASVNTPTVAVRTGDTSAPERRQLVRRPPDILITTPESLYLMLTSRARETLRSVEHVIVDEIHSLAGTKRGAHLMLSLERLEELTGGSPQRIALSATQRPLDEIARFLGGSTPAEDGTMRPRPVTVIDAGISKQLDIEVVVPVDDMSSLVQTVEPSADNAASAGPAHRSIWPSIHPSLLELVQKHRSTLIFANARQLCERLATRLNELADEKESEPEPEEPDVVCADVASSVGVDDGPNAPDAPGVACAPGVPDGPGAPGVACVPGVPDAPNAPGAPGVPGVACVPGVPGVACAHGVPGVAGVSELVKAHHGSLSRQRRLQVEEELKRGDLRGLVATSTLELGIDMGAVDLVVQVGSPRSVASGLQRIGRAGHQVGEPSRGKIFPKHRAELLEAAVIVDRMKRGLIEHTAFPRNPLDVLAQQIVAMCAMDDWDFDHLLEVVRRSANFSDLSSEAFANIVDLLSGVYPSEEFSGLRPRIVYDRATSTLRGRKGAQRLAVTNAGTIPDRGDFGVFLPDGTRVGELEEEMVHESRVGEVFLLGASGWRIEDITFERVVVTPAPGAPAKMPFWKGDGPGRGSELGRAVGEFTREIRAEADPISRLRARHDLDERAARNIVDYLQEQADATGAVPDDRTVVVERFRDEIGDWRVCVLTPFGARLHAPWGVAIRARLSEAWGADVELMWSDEGIAMRLPDALDDLSVDELLFDPEEVSDVVVAGLGGTAMFASRFRECSARALLLPRRRPDQRTPLWQQRQRAADLLAVAAQFPTFPMLLEATRECVNDVFDLPGLRRLMTDLRSRQVRVVSVETPRASPFARSLLFSWVALYMYEGDAPLAERRAALLAIDRELLADLLGDEELQELLDPEVLGDVELELQRLTEAYLARDADELHDQLRMLGPLSRLELEVRAVAGADVDAWIRQLTREQRVIEVSVAGKDRFAVADDAARLRDGAGVAVPTDRLPGPVDPVADGLVDPVAGSVADRLAGPVDPVVDGLVDPVAGSVADRLAGPVDPVVDGPADLLGDLCLRYSRTHGPFSAGDIVRWIGADADQVGEALGRLVAAGKVVRGEFRRGSGEREFCNDDVLRLLRRRSLLALRNEIEPVEAETLARFLGAWQGLTAPRRGVDGLAEVVGQLQGAPIAASVLESEVLSRRVEDYQSGQLDALCTTGELVWVGAGGSGSRDPKVRLMFRDQVRLLLGGADDFSAEPVHEALLAHLGERGASFWGDLVAAVAQAGVDYDQESVLAGLWDLVWAGQVTNDTLAPVRALVVGQPAFSRRTAPRSGPVSGSGSALGSGSAFGSGAVSRRDAVSRRGRGRPRPGSLRRQGPATGAGRWSLVAPMREPAPTQTEIAYAQARQLLDRYGILTREIARGEGIAGGFAGVYPMLRLLEERGEVRRGYFVAGLGAAQFAAPGAVDRLRGLRPVGGGVGGGLGRVDGGLGGNSGAEGRDGSEDGLIVLAATDPAQPYGSVLPWPESSVNPARAVGAFVVLRDGVCVAILERGGRSLVTFPTARQDDAWLQALGDLVITKRLCSLEISKVDGTAVRETPWATRLESAGFTPSYRGLTFRP